MPSNTWDFFKTVIIIQLVFGFAATAIAYSLPTQTYVTISQQVTPENIESLKNLTSDYNKTLSDMRNPSVNVPFIDTALLLFHSGNLVIDAFINSILAIPSMATVVVTGFNIFIPIDPYLVSMLSLVVYAFVAIIYIIGIIGVIMNLRSQGGMTNVV